MEQLTRLNFKTEICRDINDAIYRAIQNRTTKEINDILNVLKKDIEDYISENNDGTYRYTIFTKIGEIIWKLSTLTQCVDDYEYGGTVHRVDTLIYLNPDNIEIFKLMINGISGDNKQGYIYDICQLDDMINSIVDSTKYGDCSDFLKLFQ